ARGRRGHAGPGRDAARGGPASRADAHRPAPSPAARRRADARAPPPRARLGPLSDGRAGRLHELGQVDADEPPDPGGRAGRGPAVRDARPHGRARARALRPAVGPGRRARLAPARRPRDRGVLSGRRGHGHGARAAQGRGAAPQAPPRDGGTAVLTVVNIPNFLTLLRIVAIPLFLILLEDYRYGEALAVFVAAGIPDGLDGAIRPREPVRVVGFYVTGALTAVSGLQYMYRGLAWFALAAPPAALEPGQRPDDAAATRRRA